ncbi:MAG TPA: glycosyltransferase family 1 protein [Phototrophicaceae bacterium]|nr:glycosyltransferase family 1 protein [Phototrophicaceae bacterium]
MRLAIDASRTTVARLTGTEHYAVELLRAIIRLNTQHEITLYFRDNPPPDLFPLSASVTQRVIPFSRLWTHLRFAAELWKDRPDLTWVPAHTLPAIFPGSAAVTVHDLGYKFFPQAHPPRQRRYLDLTTRYSAARASIVLADSRATADDLTRFYGTPAHKIRVVYPGVAAPFVGDVERTRHRYGLPERYFLFVGTLQPRKNIARIVEAYRLWREANRDETTALVLAGGQGWLYDPAWTAGVDGVILPGYVDDADKGALYAGALALVFPSLYEGFGFPVLEAMHVGTPVICSNTSSLPELAGDAALLVDPLDEQAIAEAMHNITSDEVLRASLKAKGFAQAQKFTWDAAAHAALAAFEGKL